MTLERALCWCEFMIYAKIPRLMVQCCCSNIHGALRRGCFLLSRFEMFVGILNRRASYRTNQTKRKNPDWRPQKSYIKQSITWVSGRIKCTSKFQRATTIDRRIRIDWTNHRRPQIECLRSNACILLIYKCTDRMNTWQRQYRPILIQICRVNITPAHYLIKNVLWFSFM